MGKHVTRKDWEAAGDFTKAAMPGDTIDEEIVDYFMDVLPPASMERGYLQVGEPYDHLDDPKTGKWRATYSTFRKDSSTGLWVYCGTCFRGETEHQSRKGDPWNE